MRCPSGRIGEAARVRGVHELSDGYPRLGCRNIHGVLRAVATAVGRDRLRLIRRCEDLQVARTARTRRRPGTSTMAVYWSLYLNFVWSYDFVTDQTGDAFDS